MIRSGNLSNLPDRALHFCCRAIDRVNWRSPYPHSLKAICRMRSVNLHSSALGNPLPKISWNRYGILPKTPAYLRDRIGAAWSFAHPTVFHQFAVTEPVKPSFEVGGCFEILPVLAELHFPVEFYVLCLSKKDVGMFRCSGLHAERTKLPAGVPETLEGALGFKPPDHDLENRAAAGSSAGAMHAVRFGTGSGDERQGAYLADFYKAVDRGVRELLGAASDAPLVLAGVEEDTVLYRRSNTYAHLLGQSAHGSKGVAMDAAILLQAYSIVRSDSIERALRVLHAAKERVAPARYSTSMNSILRAAGEGRVARLYIDESARIYGMFEGIRGGEGWNQGEQDLLNIAAVETIRQGGMAFVLPSGRIPDGAKIAAIFRY